MSGRTGECQDCGAVGALGYVSLSRGIALCHDCKGRRLGEAVECIPGDNAKPHDDLRKARTYLDEEIAAREGKA
jgi:hypothetical protein